MRRRVVPQATGVRAGLEVKVRGMIARYGGPDGVDGSSWERELADLVAGRPVVMASWRLAHLCDVPAMPYTWWRVDADDTLTEVDVYTGEPIE